MKTLVYVVSRGEKGEGGNVVGVFKTYHDAEKCALVQKHYGGSWDRPNVTQPYWISGCDFVEIEIWEVL